MSKVVLDASALIALLNNEAGADQLTPNVMTKAISSTVNLAEVQSKLVDRGVPAHDAWSATLGSVQEAINFTTDQAKTAGTLITETRSAGLSLGDRACLALALDMKAPVYTADRSWKNLKVGVRIHVIR